MALVEPTGWSPKTEWIESAWHADPSVLWECPTLTTIAEAEASPNGHAPPTHPDGCAHCAGVVAYLGDGRAEHLAHREGADAPTRIRYRALTARERSVIRDHVARTAPVQNDGESAVDHYQRAEAHRISSLNLHFYLAATVALDFPDWTSAKARIDWEGLRVLPVGFINDLARMYGDSFLRQYGGWIWLASSATEDQKKTSSPTAAATKPATSTATDANENQSGASDLPAPTSGSSATTT
jgi:hypothetical protein